MEIQAESLTTVYILIMDVLLATVLLWVLHTHGATRRMLAAVGAGAALWLGFMVWGIGGQNLFPADIGSWAFFAILLCGVAGVLMLFMATPLGALFAKSGQEFLLLPQGLRAFFGAGFLVEGAFGVMPRDFAVLDGIAHITAAVLALMTALMLARRQVGLGAVWLTNLFGLLDVVVVAAGIAFVLLPQIGPHHNVMYAALFAAPVFIALHLLSLRVAWHAGVPAPVAARAVHG